jgi:four helix bundle protein
VRGAWCVVPGAVLGAGVRGCGVLCGVRGAGCAARTLPLPSYMVARRYGELVAWQLANELKQQVYALVESAKTRDDRKFFDQIKDSAASAPRNLAEGFGCYRHPDFARYTRVAKASLVETQNHLDDGVDRRHWSPQQSKPLQDLADRAIGACARLLAYLDSTDAPHCRQRRRPR